MYTDTFYVKILIANKQKEISSVMSKDMEVIKEAVSNLGNQYVAVKLKCSFKEGFQGPRPSEIKRTESLFSWSNAVRKVQAKEK